MSDNNDIKDLDLGITQEDNNSGDDDMSSFFEELDKQVNGAIYDDEPKDDNKSNGDKVSGEDSGSDIDGDDLENLKKRYDASSKEAKRLHEELKKLENLKEYAPLIDALRQDPEAVDMIKDRLTGAASPQSIKDKLGLGDDFVMDIDEAVNNPESDSAKVLEAMVSSKAESVVNQKEAIRQAQAEEQRMIKEFQAKTKMSNEELEDLIEWSKNEKLTLEHLYLLRNLDKRDREILQRSAEERNRQARKVRNLPPSLAGKGESREVSQVDKVFEGILAAQSGGIEIKKG